MEKKILNIEVGNKVGVWDKYSHDYVEHIINIDSLHELI